MPVIKRYANRKLYNTEAKQYINLDQVAALIHQGEDVQVIDHATGEDLTAKTLTQVIFEQEKKRSGRFPLAVLSNLIQAGEERMIGLQHSLASMPGFRHRVDQEIERRLDILAASGELDEVQANSLREKLNRTGGMLERGDSAQQGISQFINGEIENYLHTHNPPTRAEFLRLIDQLDDLAAKIEEL